MEEVIDKNSVYGPDTDEYIREYIQNSVIVSIIIKSICVDRHLLFQPVLCQFSLFSDFHRRSTILWALPRWAQPPIICQSCAHA